VQLKINVCADNITEKDGDDALTDCTKFVPRTCKRKTVS
jgi:hypothetical protein